MNEKINVSGYVKWEKYTNGVLVENGERANIITTVGKNALASLLTSANAGTSLVTHIGVGSSATAVSAADTTLGTELSGNGYARVAVTRTNPSGNVIRYRATITGITAAVTIQEAGLFSAITGGTLFAHQLLGPVALSTSADSLEITWEVTIS